jgi:hypothetical protein
MIMMIIKKKIEININENTTIEEFYNFDSVKKCYNILNSNIYYSGNPIFKNNLKTITLDIKKKFFLQIIKESKNSISKLIYLPIYLTIMLLNKNNFRNEENEFKKIETKNFENSFFNDNNFENIFQQEENFEKFEKKENSIKINDSIDLQFKNEISKFKIKILKKIENYFSKNCLLIFSLENKSLSFKKTEIPYFKINSKETKKKKLNFFFLGLCTKI